MLQDYFQEKKKIRIILGESSFSKSQIISFSEMLNYGPLYLHLLTKKIIKYTDECANI